MSSNRSNNVPSRALRPALTSTRTHEQSPLTPRLAHASASATSRSTPVSTPRLKQDAGDVDMLVRGDNITPRSAKRMSRVESSNNTPTQTLESPSVARAATISPLALSQDLTPSISGLSMSRPVATRSLQSEPSIPRGQFVRSPAASEVHPQRDASIESRFFHASDLRKTDLEVKRPEPKKPAAFFYADGQQDQSTASPRTLSPARSEKASSSTWVQPSIEGSDAGQIRSPAMLSPALSALSSVSPFFASTAHLTSQKPRSPSPSKENIHLSYRKGVSQIFGSRPSPVPSPRMDMADRRPSLQRTFNAHKKSPSLSSIDSGLSQRSRRRSNTAQEAQGSSPLREIPNGDVQSSPTQSTFLSIDTSLETPDRGSLSPTKAISELAADARRERKVLDLEISNSSLLAINASLERELRKQKTELKCFRRLSRAGRFASNPLDLRRESGSLGSLSEELDADLMDFGPASGLSELYSDMSDSDDESSLASGDQVANTDRLAKDERRLRADLHKHRELLVQSQRMNQSLRRCMYATEEMIKEGKKAANYKVRVSDVKLGGRILSGHEEVDDDGHAIEEMEVEDEFDVLSVASPMSGEGADYHAQKFVDIWGGIGKVDNAGTTAGRSSIGNSEIGDRDSGIEVDRAMPRFEITN